MAIGAAYQAYYLSNNNQDNNFKEISDVNSHSLGVLALNSEEELVNTIILEKNSKLPAFESQNFYTVADNQQRVLVKIAEGEDADPRWVRIIGELIVELEPKPKGSGLEISIGYDENSIITTKVTDLETNEIIGGTVIDRDSNLNEKELQAAISKISEIKVE